ncbi:MAG: hypothetical protein MRZ40_03035 [Ligilactobacillus animalis]|uniref:hypothetical protein n=1 Tax=Ligilactobacillus animalis TaxID=1605 RepID=UPI00242A8B87|nr:hypothetical protein [Ligilactobacillus animalis]MCI5941527.1 hypothetical protein [Ligilactobacillus animalis]MDY2994112.1 hypothetical protein [Ligilactobacillus animalis]
MEGILGLFTSTLSEMLASATTVLALCTAWYNIKNINQIEKRERLKIRADHISKSRIDWIKGVREHTATLLTSYNKLMNTPQKCRREYINECTREIELLCLYFQTNKTQVCKEFHIDSELLYSSSRRHIQLTMHSRDYERLNSELVDKLVSSKTNNGKNPYIVNMLQNLKWCINNCNVYNNGDEITSKYMDSLREIIGIYLKIEWDYTKDEIISAEENKSIFCRIKNIFVKIGKVIW